MGDCRWQPGGNSFATVRIALRMGEPREDATKIRSELEKLEHDPEVRADDPLLGLLMELLRRRLAELEGPDEHTPGAADAESSE